VQLRPPRGRRAASWFGANRSPATRDESRTAGRRTRDSSPPNRPDRLAGLSHARPRSRPSGRRRIDPRDRDPLPVSLRRPRPAAYSGWSASSQRGRQSAQTVAVCSQSAIATPTAISAGRLPSRSLGPPQAPTVETLVPRAASARAARFGTKGAAQAPTPTRTARTVPIVRQGPRPRIGATPASPLRQRDVRATRSECDRRAGRAGVIACVAKQSPRSGIDQRVFGRRSARSVLTPPGRKESRRRRPSEGGAGHPARSS
jgi:hypothetical protein